ncbi:hypothetical protein ACFQZZ_26140 [Nocardia sp. GCM10030253]
MTQGPRMWHRYRLLGAAAAMLLAVPSCSGIQPVRGTAVASLRPLPTPAA